MFAVEVKLDDVIGGANSARGARHSISKPCVCFPVYHPPLCLFVAFVDVGVVPASPFSACNVPYECDFLVHV